MSKKSEKVVQPKKTFKRKKQLNSQILSFRDYEGGYQGKVGELTQMFKRDGSPVLGGFDQELWTLEMTDLVTGELVKFWADGGVRGAITLANVKPGMNIEVVHTGEQEIEWEKDGKSGKGTVQTYDIFELE